jgi:hypothetical protein
MAARSRWTCTNKAREVAARPAATICSPVPLGISAINLWRFQPVALTVAIATPVAAGPREAVSPGNTQARVRLRRRPCHPRCPASNCGSRDRRRIDRLADAWHERHVGDAGSLQPAPAHAAAIGEYCRVKGIVRSVDPSAENIEFPPNLPDLVQIGGMPSCSIDQVSISIRSISAVPPI